MDQLLSEKHTPCLGDRGWGGPKMSPEQPPELSLSHAQASGERFDIGPVQGAAFNEAQSPGDDGVR